MKFKDIEYKRPELEQLKKEYEERLVELEKAADKDEYLKAFKKLNELRGHIYTMKTLCYIRHSINTADEFYDRENAYWDQTMPQLQEFEAKMAKILLESPFRNKVDIPETLYKLLEYTLKSFSPEII